MKNVVVPIVCALAFFGFGASVQLAAADSIGYETVPEAQAPSASGLPPMPSSIPSTETVPGMFVAAPSSAQRKSNEPRGYFYASVFGTEEEAKAYTAGKTAPSASPRVCLGTSRDSASNLSVRLVHVVPVAASATTARPGQAVRPPPKPMAKGMPTKTPQAPVKRPSVRFVHKEALTVSDSGQATLDVTDAWVDVLTYGARPISKWSLPLKRIATGPNKLEVYAARDGKVMQVMVRAPTVPLDGVPEKERDRYLSELKSVAEHIGVKTADSSGFDTTDCGHLRFALEYDKGTGQMASIVATAILQGGVDDEVDDPKPVEEGADDDAEDRQLAVRTRLVLGNISLTQARSENAPVLSVSWGWAAKELIVRF
jgi:hypothetical protein